ncbi:MAG: Mov34/MPN/PAD-1 family protein [Betaproteobacteria bacterium]|nr:Mov34/MPN/PAD-1 family protein [Betaproteobacteria bacterium]
MLPLETGGSVLGYWAPRTREVVIVSITGPGPGARHEKNSFAPDYAFQDYEIAQAYENSGRTITYLGDWHTHPGGGTGMSELDRRTLTRIAKSKAARATTPIMAILAGPPWAVAVWHYEPPDILAGRFCASIYRLELVESDMNLAHIKDDFQKH